ncbi:MAG TPA: hypothetical protein VFO05_15890 [Candidatus Limnocylindrales bacterium]|nr:hypothetical protein [Candidatus Limnocylindrales bacterium]
MRIRPAGLAAVLLAVAACGPTVSSPSPTPPQNAGPPSVGTGIAILGGPWRPAPVAVEPNVVTEIESACRNPADPDLRAAVEAVPVAVVDARGDSLVSVILADEHVAFECLVRTELLGGELGTTVLQQPTRLVPDATLPVEDGTIRVVSHNGVDEDAASRTILVGRVGSDAAAVIAGFPDASEVEASLAAGWFYAWWPGVEVLNAISAVDRQNVAIAGVDDPAAAIEGRVGPAAWWVDPAAGPLDPATTTIPALIRERECASGQSPEGRVVDPAVFASEDAFLVNVWVRIAPGDCPSNPEFPIEISLPEPLGDRQLLDGSEIPPRDASVRPD